MSDIFISYSSSDRNKAEQIAKALEKEGLSVWWDRDLLAGQEFNKVIMKELEDSQCILALWSKESVQSGWVLDEAREGANMHKLIPILIDKIAPPLGFRQYHSPELTNWESGFPQQEFERVLRAVKSFLGGEPQEDASENLPGKTAPSKPETRFNIAATILISLIVAIGTFFGSSLYYERNSENMGSVKNECEKKIVDKNGNIAGLIDEIGKLKTEKEECESKVQRQKAALGKLRRESDNIIYDLKNENASLRVNRKTTPSFTNSLGMEFKYIEPGDFMMGSPPEEPERGDNETQHKVTLKKGFYIQTTEVTQGQWKAVMGGNSNPSHFKDCGDDCPVESVSWDNVQKFIKELNKREGKKYRLPTEAEWEYACRAGTTTPFYFGNCLGADQANYDGSRPMKGCPKGKYLERTMPVKSFRPNAFGLYNMHGNVWEWCQDWYGKYSSNPATDPTGPSNGSGRVFRGGGWISPAWNCRAAGRGRSTPGLRYRDLGFRLVGPPGQ